MRNQAYKWQLLTPKMFRVSFNQLISSLGFIVLDSKSKTSSLSVLSSQMKESFSNDQIFEIPAKRISKESTLKENGDLDRIPTKETPDSGDLTKFFNKFLNLFF